VVEKLPGTEAAAEAMYWAGVSRYKASNDPSALKATAQAFKDRYKETSWAKKASIWG
jgi:TolA-binding protein